MAATTRIVTDRIYTLDGTPWAGATVAIERVDRPQIDSDGTIGASVSTGVTDSNGDVSLTVAVPPSGAGRYRLTRPVESGQPVDVTYFYMAAGDPIAVGEILAASASVLTEDAVQTLLNAYLSKADNLASLASAATARTNLGLGSAAVAATGDFEAAGAVAAHTDADSGAHAATAISVTPAGNLAATDVQAALEELQGDVDGMSSDVDDLTTTTGSSTNMLRVAAAGGLEYRTTAQVLADIGAAPTTSPTFTGTVTLPTTVASVIKPAVLTVDTTNGRIGINTTPSYPLHVSGSVFVSQILYLGNSDTGWFRAASGLARNNGTFSSSRLSALPTGVDYSATAFVDVGGSTTTAASLRIRSGTAPTSPNAGDLWFDGTNLKFYDGTTTRTLSWT